MSAELRQVSRRHVVAENKGDPSWVDREAFREWLEYLDANRDAESWCRLRDDCPGVESHIGPCIPDDGSRAALDVAIGG